MRSSALEFLSCNWFKIPETGAARRFRQFIAVQKQLELTRNDCHKLQDEAAALHASNTALRDQLSSIQDNSQLLLQATEEIASLKEQLLIERISTNVATNNSIRSADSLHALQQEFQAKVVVEQQVREECKQISLERDLLLDTLNAVRLRFVPTCPPFRPRDTNYAVNSRILLANLSGRFIVPWAAANAREIQLETELEELRAANISYAQELREHRQRLFGSSRPT